MDDGGVIVGEPSWGGRCFSSRRHDAMSSEQCCDMVTIRRVSSKVYFAIRAILATTRATVDLYRLWEMIQSF